jgi:hypothetical protein
VSFGLWRFIVESNTIVTQDELHLITVLANREPHVGCLGMLEGVHHALPSDVVQQERDRRWQAHLLEVEVELHISFATCLRDEAVDRL